MSEKTIEPCPFCRAENTDEGPRVVNGVVPAGNRHTGFYVWCSSCDATGPRNDVSHEVAIDEWNRRPSAEGGDRG